MDDVFDLDLGDGLNADGEFNYNAPATVHVQPATVHVQPAITDAVTAETRCETTKYTSFTHV